MDILPQALTAGIPLLITSFVVALVMFGVGFGSYLVITPYAEIALIREGVVAAGITFTGAVLAFAIPIAATLSNQLAITNILAWGLVAVLLQLLTTIMIVRGIRGLKLMIEGNNIAVALAIASAQIAIGLFNAALMSS
jgi:putative membrane protein